MHLLNNVKSKCAELQKFRTKAHTIVSVFLWFWSDKVYVFMTHVCTSLPLNTFYVCLQFVCLWWPFLSMLTHTHHSQASTNHPFTYKHCLSKCHPPCQSLPSFYPSPGCHIYEICILLHSSFILFSEPQKLASNLVIGIFIMYRIMYTNQGWLI